MLETGNSRISMTGPAAVPKQPARVDGDLVGYVARLEVYVVPAFNGCCAYIALRDAPSAEPVAVLSRDPKVQALFEAALVSNKLVAVFGERMYQQTTPAGARWADEVYNVYRVVLHNLA